MKRIIRYLLLVFTVLIAIFGIRILLWIYSGNVIIKEPGLNYINIPTGSEYKDVKDLIEKNGFVENLKSFDWVAGKKNYGNNINPGHYILKDGMNNNELINLLRSGNQTPVNVIFNNIGSLEELSGVISSQLEADSSDLIDLLLDESYISQFKFSNESIMGAFIPNTYEFYWNTSAGEFIERMIEKYNRFWTKERKAKADAMDFTINEVSTLASIVDGETIMTKEKPVIAGVYLNRLKRGWRLQADPTVKFAIKDSSRRRILKKDLKINSPYNTYVVKGLPPGPILVPSVSGLDAVLNAEEHSYLYFCAKEDLSGFHHFSKTLSEHLRYARKYWRALNKEKIMN